MVLETVLKTAPELIDAINEMIDLLNGPLLGKLDVLTRVAKEIREIMKGDGNPGIAAAWMAAATQFVGPPVENPGPLGLPVPGPR